MKTVGFGSYLNYGESHIHVQMGGREMVVILQVSAPLTVVRGGTQYLSGKMYTMADSCPVVMKLDEPLPQIPIYNH